MQITFLGTGTSTGVPQMGCTCPVCTSADPHDNRLRTSALVETDCGDCLLIDCGPDFRTQMLAHCRRHPQPVRTGPIGDYSLPRLAAVLLTHEHYDHVGGLDDLRPFCSQGPVDIYAEQECADSVRGQMPYCFRENPYPGSPQIRLHTIVPHQELCLGGERVVPVRVMHGKSPILGFRIGNLAYITDMSMLPASELPLLEGVRLLVVNALRFEPHPTHQTIQEAVDFSRLLGNPPTYLIHLGHKAPLHAESRKALPVHVAFAYDGLTLDGF